MECVLRKLGPVYADDIVKALNDVRIRDNLRDLPCPYTIVDAEEFISDACADDGKNFVFAITLGDKFAGCISATRGFNVHRRTAEVGYYIVPELWGRGLATQALGLLCDYIFGKTDVIRLYAEPFARNSASCRVLEKSGFAYEGTLRCNAVKSGKAEDMKVYAKLQSGIEELK